MAVPNLHVTGYPARPVSVAKFGYNMQSTWNNSAWRALAAAGGAQHMRTQWGWEGDENALTGALSVPAGGVTALEHATSLGLQVILIAAYGSPRTQILTLTVASNTAIGSTVIPVNESVAGIDPPYCHVLGAVTHIASKSAYYGALIHSVQTGPKTLTLASATTVTLTAGDSLRINRLRYPSIATDQGDDPSAVAFLRYARHLADTIHDAGATGWVELWNEPPWAGDLWENRNNFYDDPEDQIYTSGGMNAINRGALTMAMPAGVKLINGGSHLTGFQGLVGNYLPTILTGPTPGLAFSHDGIHPYANNPESHGWAYQPDYLEEYGAGWYQSLNPPLEQGSNFRAMAAAEDNMRTLGTFPGSSGGIEPNTPYPFATETGCGVADDTRQAICMVRRVISLWGMNTMSSIYSMDDMDSYFAVAPGLVPRPAYTALKNLADLVARMDPGPGIPSAIPTIVGWPDNDVPAMTVGIYGATGHSILFVWQRTMNREVSDWFNMTPLVGTKTIELSMPTGVSIAEAITVRTEAAVSTSISGGTLSLEIGEEPVGIRLEPTL